MNIIGVIPYQCNHCEILYALINTLMTDQKKMCNTFLNNLAIIHIKTGIVTLNLYNYIYYVYCISIIMAIKINDCSIDVYYSNFDMTYEYT